MRWLDDAMSLESDYVPSPRAGSVPMWSGSRRAGDTGVVHRQGRPVVLVTMRGAKSGARCARSALMRVEHEGELVIVASLGGAPEHPKWYWNLAPTPTSRCMTARVVPGPGSRAGRQGKFDWWVRAVGAFPPYAGTRSAQRLIPLFLLERR